MWTTDILALLYISFFRGKKNGRQNIEKLRMLASDILVNYNTSHSDLHNMPRANLRHPCHDWCKRASVMLCNTHYKNERG